MRFFALAEAAATFMTAVLSMYIGDGSGDFCPATKMRAGDVVLALVQGAARRALEALLEAPAALAGQPLVFDYRVLHRGLANPSRERAVAYLVLATDGAYDGQNFCQMSLNDALPAHVEQMCLWSDYE